MLKCIFCGEEYPEEINETHCFCGNSKAEYTNLYSTSIKNYPFKETPLEKIGYNNVYGLDPNICLKREDKNPFGTFKDRKSTLIKHLRVPYFHKGKHAFTVGTLPFKTKFALASSGNQAISFSNICPEYAQSTYLYVSPNISDEKLAKLHIYKEITFTNKILSDGELRKFEDDRWNITNGMDPLGASALYKLGMELEPYNFDNIIVPLGSGELYSMLAVYFGILRKKPTKIYPVQCKLPETDAIKTDFVAMTPFLQHFNPQIVELYKDDRKNIQSYTEAYGCEFSSAVVFVARDVLNLPSKTCLVVTGAKK